MTPTDCLMVTHTQTELQVGGMYCMYIFTYMYMQCSNGATLTANTHTVPQSLLPPTWQHQLTNTARETNREMPQQVLTEESAKHPITLTDTFTHTHRQPCR